MQFTDNEELYQTVLIAPIGICILNAQTLTAEIVNDKFLEVAGKPYETIFGLFYWDAFAEALAYYETALTGVVETGIAYYADEIKLMLIRHGKEEMIFVTFVYAPVKNVQGTVVKVAVWVLENTRQVTERQKIEAGRVAIKQERDRLKDFFMQAPAGICVLNGPELVYELVNPGYQALLPGRKLLNRPIFEALPEIIGTPLQDVLINVYRTGEPYEIKELLIPVATFEGGATINRYFTFNYIARKDAEDQVDGILAFVHEVTESVRSQQEQYSLNEELAATNEESAAANEELAASNEQLLLIQKELEQQTLEKQTAIERLQTNEENIRNMVRQAPVGICIVQGEPLYVVEVKDSFLELIGKTREALQTTPYWVVNSEAAPYYEPITDQVLATGETYHANEHEIMLIRNGVPETVHVDFVYEPMKDANGKAYAIMIVAIDITDKFMARRKVERVEESLRMAVDAAGLGTYFINVTDRIFYPSARLKEFFGFLPDEEVPYEAAINQIHPDYRQKAADMVEAAFTKGERFDMEYPVIGHHDGTIRWVRGIGTMQHYDGKDFFTGVLHEITENKKDEMRKNDFIEMVSHELKTPLTSLTAILQLLKIKLSDGNDPFVPGAVDKANVQVKKMSAMINGFLNISRLESGKIAIEKREFDLEELIAEVIEETKLTSGTQIIEFSQCGSGVVNADRDKIASVITNLLSNAVKYSPKGKTIHVQCDRTGNDLKINIRDEGIGISSEDLKNIFGRYFRVVKENIRHFQRSVSDFT